MADITEQVAIVLHAFGDYARGEIVRGEAALATIRREGRIGLVVLADILVPQAGGTDRGKA